ncbi:MAG: hypothetical protein H8E57_05090 [Candidatus Cloacimonetes bacterium]|nr:hypothetical protein [Candidatus Cloacimonadota bacterium]
MSQRGIVKDTMIEEGTYVDNSNAFATIFTSATLTYADTNEHALASAATEIKAYADYVLEIKITYAGNPNDVYLTIGATTTNQVLTGDQAFAQLTSEYWSTNEIDLNTSGGTDTFSHKLRLAATDLLGKYLHTKYEYSGDPGNDPTVAVTLNKI